LALARILAAQNCWDEGVLEGERAVECFSVSHDPPDDFLTFRIEEVERMRIHRDMERG
jgi:hypothetical protein